MEPTARKSILAGVTATTTVVVIAGKDVAITGIGTIAATTGMATIEIVDTVTQEQSLVAWLLAH